MERKTQDTSVARVAHIEVCLGIHQQADRIGKGWTQWEGVRAAGLVDQGGGEVRLAKTMSGLYSRLPFGKRRWEEKQNLRSR